MDLPPRLGKYEVLMPIAAGGMARIYLARTSGVGSFERHVVLKVILPERMHDPTAVAMFYDEARLAASLNHANVAQVFEVGNEHQVHYLAMEYVHGQDMRAVLSKAGAMGVRLPIELALTVVAGAAAGLHHAHERCDSEGKPQKIVHRDVSPSNVMVGYDGAVKVLDFGIAKAAERSVETQSGVIKGKFAYMSPEQCRGRDIDHRSDVFALGIVLFECTTQHRCFRAESDFDTMHRIVTGDVTRPSKLVPGYPLALESIVLKALALDPAKRYQTAGLLMEAIEAYAQTNGISMSSSNLGRFMRELFGEVPEPWITVRPTVPNLAGQFPKESTISNTNSREAVAGEVLVRRKPATAKMRPAKTEPSNSVIGSAPPTLTDPEQAAAIEAAAEPVDSLLTTQVGSHLPTIDDEDDDEQDLSGWDRQTVKVADRARLPQQPTSAQPMSPAAMAATGLLSSPSNPPPTTVLGMQPIDPEAGKRTLIDAPKRTAAFTGKVSDVRRVVAASGRVPVVAASETLPLPSARAQLDASASAALGAAPLAPDPSTSRAPGAPTIVMMQPAQAPASGSGRMAPAPGPMSAAMTAPMLAAKKAPLATPVSPAISSTEVVRASAARAAAPAPALGKRRVAVIAVVAIAAVILGVVVVRMKGSASEPQAADVSKPVVAPTPPPIPTTPPVVVAPEPVPAVVTKPAVVPATEPPLLDVHELIVDSKPEGATVTVDDRRLGVTPLHVNVHDGSKTARLVIKLSKYETERQVIDLTTAVNRTVELRPVSAAPRAPKANAPACVPVDQWVPGSGAKACD